MALSNPVIHKKRRGPPATGKTPLVALRIPALLSADLDAWIGAQPEPTPSRSEAIRQLLTEALARSKVAASMRSEALLDRQIADKETVIAEMPQHSEPSPEAGMAAMDKAVAENDLIDMKNKRTRRKNAKRG
jgi:hypothetical protein